MTDPELRQLALDYVNGKVWTTNDVPQELWRIVFVPLGFVKSPKSFLRGVKMVYAKMGEDKTTGQAINGYPIFFSCKVLKARDTKKFIHYVVEAGARNKEFVGE